VIINDGYVSSQPYKCLWIRGFCGLAVKALVMLFGYEKTTDLLMLTYLILFAFRYWINI